MMRRRDNANRQTAYAIHGVCGLLFIAFAVHFLFVEQSEVLLLTYALHDLSNTPFEHFRAAMISVAVLVIGALAISRFSHRIPLELKALVWAPSYFGLGLLASLCTTSEYSVGHLFWTFFCLILLASAIVLTPVVSHPFAVQRIKWLHLSVPNLLVTLCSMVICWTVTNNDLDLHRDLETARLVRQGRFAELMSSPRQMGRLTQRLLSPDNIVGRTMQVPEHLYRYLGYVPQSPSMPLERFLDKAILAEQLNDTVPDARTLRMTRLQTFRASLP